MTAFTSPRVDYKTLDVPYLNLNLDQIELSPKNNDVPTTCHVCKTALHVTDYLTTHGNEKRYFCSGECVTAQYEKTMAYAKDLFSKMQMKKLSSFWNRPRKTKALPKGKTDKA